MPARRTTTAAPAARSRPRTVRASAAPVVALPEMVMQVRPMVVKCEYLLSTVGHRFLGVLHGTEVIDTGYHRTVEAAAAAYGAALAPLAVQRAARFLES